jgi:hypothetical protein
MPSPDDVAGYGACLIRVDNKPKHAALKRHVFLVIFQKKIIN